MKFKFVSIRQKMLNQGANPFVQDTNGNTNYAFYSISSTNLTNLPKKKSVFFPIVDFGNSTLLGPWQYKTGVFPGQFNRLIGSGGEGHVVAGIWNNEKAAYKWVPIGKQEFKSSMHEVLADMEMKLSEMRTMQTTIGTSIMPIIGHFR